MGIEKLTSSLLTEANSQASELVKSAEWHVEQMISEERAKDKNLMKDAEAEISDILKSQRNERIAWARLEVKRILAEAREDAINNTLEDFFSQLKSARSSKEYKQFLKTSIRGAVNDLGGQKLIVHVVKGDAKLVEKIPNARIIEDLQGFGGVIVETTDGKMRVNMTLETLVESRKDELRKRIYDLMFSK